MSRVTDLGQGLAILYEGVETRGIDVGVSPTEAD